MENLEFTTAVEALKHIKKNKSTGTEIVINDCLHYGVDTYMWKDQAIEMGVKFTERPNSLFVTPLNVNTVLKKLQERDGQLITDFPISED